MKTVDRYLLREIAVPFGVGMGLFFVVISFGQLLKISDSVTGLGITGGEVFRALVYSLPPLVGVLIPVSTLFATMLAVGRLASDREILALCASGSSPLVLLRVPLFFGCCLSLIAVVSTSIGEPWGVRGLRELMSRSAQRALVDGVRVGEFTEWVPGVTLLAREHGEGQLKGVFFSDRRIKDRPMVVSARRGKVVAADSIRHLVFELHNGVIWMTRESSQSYRVVYFDELLYRLDVDHLVGNKAKTLTTAQEKYIPELLSAIDDPKQKKRRALHMVTLHRKFAIPLATIIFAVLAVLLSSSSKPGARARGFLYSAMLVAAYYYVGRAVELQARNGEFPPVLAAWVPNLCALVAVALLLPRFRGGGGR